nr:SDR family NAD(P)-dependent oxidoreductase [Microbacterium ureisolvens]
MKEIPVAATLEGKTAIVTGAASGMGRAAAVALLEAGAAVVAADVTEAGLATLPSSPQLATIRCDVTNPADVKAVVELAEKQFGALDVVCNAAGICTEEPFGEVDDVWQRTMNINLNGTVNMCRAAIPALKRAGGGSIVNWGSINSFVATPELSAYSISKAAVHMLSMSLAVEFAADGIRANTVCPGHTATPMMDRVARTYPSEAAWQQVVAAIQPLGLGTPDAVADVVVFLASDASRIMTGSAVMTDGGQAARSASVAPPPAR